MNTTSAAPSPSDTRRGLRSWHKFNAFILMAFIAVHFINHLSGLFGIKTYNTVQDAFRTVYRFPPIELILLLAISSQLILGAILLVRSLRRGRPKGFWAWAQVLSGGLFFFFMAEHLYALFMTRLVFHLDTNFSWPASVMSGPPFTYYFVPYYFLGVFAVMTHIGTGLRYWAIDAGREALGNWIGIGFMLAGALIGATIIPILTGVLYPIPLTQEWLDYLRYFLPSYMPPAG